MNRIAGRAGIALVLVLILAGGLLFFAGEYLFQAGNWIDVGGSYRAGSVTAGVVTDRDGNLLLNMTQERTYAASESLRKATIHWLGDREGNISAPALPHYARALSGFDIIHGVYSESGTGGKAELTLSAAAQTAALEALGDYKGTIAVYNYRTGQILCAVSTPTYDPDDVPDISGDTTGRFDGVYLNRFTQASYVPGSIFKILTTAAALEQLPGLESETLHCDGSFLVDGNEVTCGRVHGDQSLMQALENSCNCAYAQIALRLGAQTLESYVQTFQLTQSIAFDGITTAEGNFDLSNATAPEIAWSAIGQHTDEVNPCRFMTFMGMIAGGGNAAQPYLVERVSADGKTTYAAECQMTGQLMEETTARRLQELMRNNVVSGYGDENFPGLTVCGKSGTAEIGDDRPSNAMFAGFVLDEDYPLAFFAAVEEGGYGRYTCIPMLSSVLAVCKDVLDQ